MIIFLATQVNTQEMQATFKLEGDKFLLSYFYLILKNSAIEDDNLIVKKELDRFLDFMTKRKGFKK